MTSPSKQREMTNSALTGEHEPRQLTCLVFILNVSLFSGFSFAKVLTVTYKENNYSTNINPYFFFYLYIGVVLGVAVVVT